MDRNGAIVLSIAAVALALTITICTYFVQKALTENCKEVVKAADQNELILALADENGPC